MRSIYHDIRRLPAWTILILPGILTLGCDRPLPIHPEVPTERQIIKLVEDVEDVAHSPGELNRVKPLFAPGFGPSNEALLRYPAYRYEGKPPVLSGDSATVTVIVTDAKTGKPAGELQWSMTKVNGRWRLQDAPLPAAAP